MFREIQPLQIYDFCTALKTIIFAHTLVAYMIKMNRVLKPSILPVNNLETYWQYPRRIRWLLYLHMFVCCIRFCRIKLSVLMFTPSCPFALVKSPSTFVRSSFASKEKFCNLIWPKMPNLALMVSLLLILLGGGQIRSVGSQSKSIKYILLSTKIHQHLIKLTWTHPFLTKLQSKLPSKSHWFLSGVFSLNSFKENQPEKAIPH